MPRYSLTKQKLREPKARVSRNFVWIDPYPEIPGTKPEKMVYAELVRRQIPFQFQEWFHVDIANLETASWLRPDFIIPGAKILIPIQGSYFHSQPDTIAKDSLQFAIYEMMGWTVVPWWEYDIESRLQDLFMEQPRLLALSGTGAPIPHVSKWYDDLKGLRKALSKRGKPWTHKPAGVKLKRKNNVKKINGIFG